MKNISIDDFSHCKRKLYFSILVDNDTRKRLEVVSSRQQPEVVETLRKFKNVETVTRDFSRTYKAAISEALPNAKQIVDRFHILKNLTEDILEYLKRRMKDKVRIADLSPAPICEKEVLNIRERRKIETGLRKWEVIKEAQRLKRAEILQIPEINSFLKLIRSDLEAVKNAIKYDYSNGPTEGHNNKIKVIKRQMYGRCKFDLLRLKVLC